jgi:hypothetical protein
MFKKKEFTKWTLIGGFVHNCNSYVIQARGDKKTGGLFFKRIKVGEDDYAHSLPRIDTQKAWDTLILQLNTSP